ncbi:MAG: pyruvate kinase [Candidatus Omnitrophica bacterium]|nr:pyruvate kinase [Candidatus Omnitrophota bacterium]
MNIKIQTPLKLSVHKTKIVCTIGPSSSSPSRLAGMIESGMSVARLNFSHGDFKEHAKNIRNIRMAASKARRMVSVIIDLPGVKIRIGLLQNESVMLKKGAGVVLTTRDVAGTQALIPVEYKKLPKSVSRGNIIFLNDGFIQLKVEKVSGCDIFCKVLIGGKLRSHKGINLPGVKLNMDPITDRDLTIVDFGLKHGVDIFGLSFVESPKDIIKVREFAKKKGRSVYLVAKIERREAIVNFDEILKVADAVMIARGDLGVEIPLEEVPGIQKRLIQKANIMGRPVITATQMLESMTQNVRPTRAEVNDVANAILDGTDAVMLSEETAMGDFPIETVRMMARIALTTEGQREEGQLSDNEEMQINNKVSLSRSLTITDVTSLNAARASREMDARYILTPTASGNTARRVSRFKPHCWVLAFSAHSQVCEFLNFSYGVQPFILSKKFTLDPHKLFKNLLNWHLLKKGDTLILTERRLSLHQGGTDSLGIVTL